METFYQIKSFMLNIVHTTHLTIVGNEQNLYSKKL